MITIQQDCDTLITNIEFSKLSQTESTLECLQSGGFKPDKVPLILQKFCQASLFYFVLISLLSAQKRITIDTIAQIDFIKRLTVYVYIM